MGTETSERYYCDKCKKSLKVYANSLDIVTSLSEAGFWERLHVKIENVSGVDNNSSTRDADLCQQCCIKLLSDALQRVKSGERASAGTEQPEMMRWGKTV